MTEYYVDSNAAAGGNGSLAAPWDAITDITGLNDGDTVYFARGGTYAGRWTIANTGITADAYGTGAKPILQGDGPGANTFCIVSDGYGGTFRNLKFTTSQRGIQAGGAIDGFTVEDCDFDGLYYTGVNFGATAAGEYADNVTIRRCDFRNITEGTTASSMIGIGGRARHVLIEYNTAYNGVDFLVHSGSVQSDNAHDWVIRYNTADLMSENFVDFKGHRWDHATEDDGYTLVYGNTTTRISLVQMLGTFAANVGTRWIKFYNNVDSGSAVFISLLETTVDPETYKQGWLYFYNNIAYNGTNKTVSIASTVNGPFFIDNNTFAEWGTASDGASGINILGGTAGGLDGTTKSSFRNNIMYNVGKGRADRACTYSWANTETNMLWKNNIWKTWNDATNVYYAANVAGTGYANYTVASFMSRFAAEEYTGELAADPLFVNAEGGNFRLRANSPARDAGVAIAWVTTDFAGASRAIGSAPDIGAHEWFRPGFGFGFGFGF